MPIYNPAAAINKLDDIGDVDVPSPTDGYIVYWDAATSLWKCKALPPSAPHKTTHQDGGTDEISLAALSGNPADTINKSLLTTKGDVIVRDATTPQRLAIGANDQVLTADSAQALGVKWAAAAAGAADFPKKLKPNIARYTMPGWYVAYYSSTSATAGRIYYTPIFVEETTTYIRIGIEVSTASTGTADLRIFAWNNGVPGSLILSAGTVDTGTTGAKEITISKELTRNYYFLAIRCTGSPTLYTASVTYAITCPVSGIGDNYRYPYGVIPFVDAEYADPAPAPTNITTAAYAYVRLREN